MALKLKVTLVRSGINRPETQKETIRRLGLRKLNASVIVPDNASVRGMIRSVSHLVQVQSGDDSGDNA
jgi:large subunit ribosomal protein L30